MRAVANQAAALRCNESTGGLTALLFSDQPGDIARAGHQLRVPRCQAGRRHRRRARPRLRSRLPREPRFKPAALVDSYFGQDGTVAELVAAQVAPVKTEVLQALQGVRELIVGQAMAADERQRSPASGLDFEDEV